MKLNIIELRRSYLSYFGFVLASFVTLLPGAANAKNNDASPPQLVYDGIPAKWNYYFVKPEIISKHKGVDDPKLCLGADFIKSPDLYNTLKVRNASTSRGGISDTHKYIVLKGGKDFSVIDKKTLLIKTPQTGVHVIETRFCRKYLNRAKYLLFRADSQRTSPEQCLHTGGNLTLMTRQKSGVATCEIGAMNQWSGAFSAHSLNPESDKSGD